MDNQQNHPHVDSQNQKQFANTKMRLKHTAEQLVIENTQLVQRYAHPLGKIRWLIKPLIITALFVVPSLGFIYMAGGTKVLSCYREAPSSEIDCSVTNHRLFQADEVVFEEKVLIDIEFDIDHSSDGDTCKIWMTDQNESRIYLTSYSSGMQCSLEDDAQQLESLIHANSSLSYPYTASLTVRDGYVFAGIGLFVFLIGILRLLYQIMHKESVRIVVDKSKREVRIAERNFFVQTQKHYPFTDINTCECRQDADLDGNTVTVGPRLLLHNGKKIKLGIWGEFDEKDHINEQINQLMKDETKK